MNEDRRKLVRVDIFIANVHSLRHQPVYRPPFRGTLPCARMDWAHPRSLSCSDPCPESVRTPKSCKSPRLNRSIYRGRFSTKMFCCRLWHFQPVCETTFSSSIARAVASQSTPFSKISRLVVSSVNFVWPVGSWRHFAEILLTFAGCRYCMQLGMNMAQRENRDPSAMYKSGYSRLWRYEIWAGLVARNVFDEIYLALMMASW
jgi:hypothetical protein